MKKFILLAFIIFTTHLVQAQTYKWWTWSSYKVKFKTPSSFKVIANNAEEFKAENVCIGFDIFPRIGESLSYSEMKNAIYTWADKSRLYYDKEPVYLKDINGYWGIGLDAEYNSVPVALFLLIDPNYPNISFYLWFDYDHAEDVSTCLSILKSFTPI